MLHREFEIPAENMADFSEMLAETELANEVKGTNDDGEIIIEVSYSSKEREKVFDLIQWVEENVEIDEESEEDSDED